jgi:regulator of replication initiation timing
MNDKDKEAFDEWLKTNIKNASVSDIGKVFFVTDFAKVWQAACEYKQKEYSNIMDAMTQTSQYNYKLQAENKKLREALSNWILWEDEQIKRNGAYVGFDLNCLINQAREALKEI